MDTIGQKLKEARSKLGLSIDDVCGRTKIRPHILAALEENDFAILQPVYIKSFLKTYATYLKFTQNEISEFIETISKDFNTEIAPQAYTESEHPINQKAQFDFKEIFKKRKYLKSFNQKIIINYLIYTGLILASFLLIYLALFYDDSEKSLTAPENESMRKSDTIEIKTDEKDLLSFFEKPDSLILEAQAQDTAWLKIDVDGNINEPVLLLPGSYKRWSAKQYFNLTVGNVGAVKFIRNGKLLEPFGTRGSVVRNVKITADKVEVSSSPWQSTEAKKKEQKPKEKKEVHMIEPSDIQATPRIRR